MQAGQKLTDSEAIELAERMGIWDQQIKEWVDIQNQILSADKATKELTKSINNIPRDVEINIRYIYHREGREESYAEGGIVPGPIGAPRRIIAHGGEIFLGMKQSIEALKLSASLYRPPVQAVNNTTNFNFEANYAYQPEATLRLDAAAIVARSKR